MMTKLETYNGAIIIEDVSGVSCKGIRLEFGEEPIRLYDVAFKDGAVLRVEYQGVLEDKLQE